MDEMAQGRYSAKELRLMVSLVTQEMADRFAESVLKGQHEQAKAIAEAAGSAQVRGVCPTMFRTGQPIEDDGIDCSDLVTRLKQHAAEVAKGGVYR